MALEQPKKPAGGAFGRFMAEKRADFQKKCAGQPVTAVTKLGAETWGKLSEQEKAPYQKAFEAAKAKYEKDFAAFIEAGGVKTKGVAALRAEKRKAKEGGRKGKAPKDPNRPKKPAGGAFGCFLDKNRQQFMKECQGQSITAVTKMAAAKWKELSEKEKAPFQKAYEEKKAKFDKAMESYVPPAGAAEEEDEEEEEEEGEEEEEEGEEKATPSPAAKKARTTQKASPQAKKAETSQTKQSGDADVMAQAKKENLQAKLTTLMARPEITAKKLKTGVVFKALQDAEGKVPAAKRALLGA